MAGFSFYTNSEYSSPFSVKSSSSGSLFSSSQPASSTSLFGSSPCSVPAFGIATPPSSAPSTSLFGSGFVSPSSSASFSTASPSLFGYGPSQSPSNLFGSGSGIKLGSGGLFGASSGTVDRNSFSTSSATSPPITSSVSATAPPQSTAPSPVTKTTGVSPPSSTTAASGKSNASIGSTGTGTSPYSFNIMSAGSSSSPCTSLSFSNVNCVIERMNLILPVPDVQSQEDTADDGPRVDAGSAENISLSSDFMSRFAAMERKVDAIYQWHLSQGHFPDASPE